MSEFQRSECFVDRTVRLAGIVEFNGWRLKQYDISFDGAPVSEVDFHSGISLALKKLPQPAIARNRPGVGFLIRHAGRSADYVVLAWWDNQNELLTRIIVRDVDTSWQDAAGRYSFCIWDMKVFWHERNAFV